MTSARPLAGREHLALTMRALKLVWRGGRRLAAASIVLLVVQALLPLVSIYLLKVVFDTVTQAAAHGGPDATRRVVIAVASLAAVSVLSAIIRAIAGTVSEAQSLAVTSHVQSLIDTQAVRVDLAYYENPGYQDTLHRAQLEGAFRPTMIANGVVQLLQNLISLAAIAALIVAYDIRIAALLVAAAIPGLVVRVRYAGKLYRQRREQTPTERHVDYFGWILSAEPYAKEVRLFGFGPEFIRTLADLRERLRTERLSLSTRIAFADVVTQCIAVAALVGSLALVVLQTVQGRLTIGDLVMYYQAFLRGQSSLGAVLGAIGSLYESNLFLANLYEFLSIEPRVADPPKPLALRRPWTQGVRLESVSFSYPGDSGLVLDSVNLAIRPGEVVGLVGENGSGKTTLVKLLCRFYDPSSGRITVDGAPLDRLAQSDLRRDISAVFQSFMQYQLSVRENVRLGDVARECTESGLDQAAQAAGLATVVKDLPRGYDTTLGTYFDESRELSLGQWQRVAIARALYRDAQLLILDEATNSLDARAEAELLARLRHACATRAVLVISHRLSAVRGADRICVLERGRLIEEGTHERLLASQGTYAALFEAQVKAGERS